MSPDPTRTPTAQWFLFIARLEGISVLLLFFVAMPLKRLAGMPEPVAWVGWSHGVLVFLYLLALGSVSRVDAWSWGRTALAFGASLFPLGTFWFERRLRKAKA